MIWYVKSKRAQTNTDDETWMGGGVVPTVNGFDMGDSRATTLVFTQAAQFAQYREGAAINASDYKRPEMTLVVEPRVRRLMSIECERLQGFPDDWTAGQKDTPRYKQMGNAVAVPVVEWILRRITDIETTHNDA